MKAILEFNLDEPEDQRAHRRCIESTKMAIALFEILNNSWRNVRDVEHYQEKINEICSDINLDELIY
jgi:hypothetical protein